MARREDESAFSYPITRPYPFWWFTSAVIVGDTICAALFSFVAVAADGYNVNPEYVLDLNDTISKSYWFQQPPLSWQVHRYKTFQ